MSGAAVFCAFVIGCGSDPDVVVVSSTPSATDTGGAFDFTTRESCRPGRYKGNFNGELESQYNLNEPFNGEITFTLKEGLNGEFLELQNSRIEGVTSQNIPFSADIVGSSRCATGEFDARLENGTFELNGYAFQFEGPVTGEYDPEIGLFSGRWSTTELSTMSLIGDGDWFAGWIAEE